MKRVHGIAVEDAGAAPGDHVDGQELALPPLGRVDALLAHLDLGLDAHLAEHLRHRLDHLDVVHVPPVRHVKGELEAVQVAGLSRRSALARSGS